MKDYNFPNEKLRFITEKLDCRMIISKNEHDIFTLQSAGSIRFATQNDILRIKKMIFYYQNSEMPCLIIKVLIIISNLTPQNF